LRSPKLSALVGVRSGLAIALVATLGALAGPDKLEHFRLAQTHGF
jgi:hypothetical protein